MNDYLEILHEYKEDKDIDDLISDVQKLRYYYSTQQYDLMIQHINNLMIKHLTETLAWNSVNKIQPVNYDQSYQNAEDFLQAKGFVILLKKGYDLSKHLKQEEINFIKQMIKPME
ncbi:MAG: hypothetical protein IJC07_03050 [Clostridia bacterium]|nr:hypothetical protein [Clostridia bacterium]